MPSLRAISGQQAVAVLKKIVEAACAGDCKAGVDVLPNGTVVIRLDHCAGHKLCAWNMFREIEYDESSVRINEGGSK